MKTQKVRVVVFGAAGVGKTCIIRRFTEREVPEKLHKLMQVEDEYFLNYFYRFNSKNGNAYKLDILDTSGAYVLPAMKTLAIEKGNVFFLVYSITDPSSFEHVCRVRQEILSMRDEKSIRIFVLCNKVDSSLENAYAEESIVVKDWGYEFIRTSARLNIGIMNSFMRVIPSGELIVSGHRRKEAMQSELGMSYLQKMKARRMRKNPSQRFCTYL
ncbi:GTP-binding protein Di-Ras2-like [Tubulanus polymorphus]|uniref:GTP-binding protein Di-Ras2-like n=1 Tax=Tubulanus polymorphus TaxID=672921 RepID=UPI003DA36DD1